MLWYLPLIDIPEHLTLVDGGYRFLYVGIAGQHDADSIRGKFLCVFQKLSARLLGHSLVGDDK